MSIKNPTRRQLIVAGGLAGGGLLLGYAFSGPSRHTLAERAVAGKGEQVLATWLKISPDNTVTIYVPHADMGQGVVTSLAMMAAEEMEADWSLVRAEVAPAEKAFANESFGLRYTEGVHIPPMFQGLTDAALLKVAQLMNVQITGGSSSVRWTGEHGMRPAGASAKDMLVRAAAARWNVAPGECVAKLSHVTHPSGKSATYAELANDAAELSPPSHPVLKSKADFTIIGKPIPRFDIPSKVNGTALYGIDARRPGQLYAAIKFVPVFGGDVVSYDEKQVLSRRGVRKVVRLPGVGVAVVADNYWRAKEAANALDIKIDAKGNDAVSMKTIYAQHDADLAKDKGSKDVEIGDADAALGQAAKRIETTYRVPYLAHACMEPMNCTVWIHGEQAEVWVGSQSPLTVRGRVADIAGLDFGNVKVHPYLLGGGFGRRVPVVKGFLDFPSEIDFATLIAKEVDAPVQLLYTREDDIQHDAYRIAVTSTFKAALDANGNPVAWANRYTSKDEPGEAAHIPYAVPNQSIRYVESPTAVPRGPWRSVAHSQHTFFTESFMDELAHEAGKDPFEYRRKLLKNEPRHLAVLELAAAKAGWGTPLEKGHARGIAIQQAFKTIVAEVVEVSVSPSGDLKVHRVTAAVDCGSTVNPDTAAQQVESGIIFGLTAALHGEITIEGGAVAQSNFTDYEMVRMADVPAIEVHFIDSGAELGGLGEPATPPVAAAVANAVFAATGKRIRELPLKNHDLTPLTAKMAQAAD
ncbi:MAG: molybdopterin-dependent oxidoreductase [Parvibaculum sp.]|jgi:isoquinoline 1-oxidoreductase beta subunit|uniref:xanthine dehydrogenase family protein molybdopterin-binding subunit n=1 Tax=Parvibaculum sp. TaxID=2024848 RepID=UPI00284A8189|nr:molybdopterin cofactor-binding domain-containing protein [Parvibaculum sp.]MDR3500319.1 molybdopterin-dependent oxidoreductase [Parvibaculum sp.]